MPPLQDQVISLSFSQGLQTKSDRKQVMPTNLLQLENAVFKTPMALSKRNGYLSQGNQVYNTTGPTTITNGNSMGSLNNDLVMTDGQFLYSQSKENDQWVNVGSRQACSTSTETISSKAGKSHQVSRLPSGIELHSYIQSSPLGTLTSLAFVYYDSLSHSILFTGEIDNVDVTCLYSFINGNNFNIIYGDITSGQIQYIVLPEVPPLVIPTPVNLVAFSATNPFFDVIQQGTIYYLGYAAVTTSLPTIASYSNAFALTHGPSTINSEANHLQGIRVGYDSFNNNIAILYMADYAGTTKPFFGEYSITLTQITTPFIGFPTISQNHFNLAFAIYSATKALIYIEFGITVGANVFPFIQRYDVNYIALTVNAVAIASGVNLYGRPFLDDMGSIYCAMACTQQLQPSIFVIRDIPGTPGFIAKENYVVAKFAYLTGPVSSSYISSQTTSISSPNGLALGGVTNIIEIDDDNWIIPYPNSVYENTINSVTVHFYNAFRGLLTFNTKTRYVAIADTLELTGGVMSTYDGKNIFEQNFHLFPAIGTAGFNPVPGSIPPGTWSFALVYEFIDNKGNVTRSAPGFLNSVTIGGGASSNHFTITFPYLTLSDLYKAQNTIIKIYRTQSLGTVYFLVGQIANDTSGAITSFNDSLLDSQIVGNDQLYTTGGELANFAPPSTDLICTFENRIIAVDSQNPLNWFFTKQVILGFPAEFSNVLQQTIDQKGGNITAIAAMDDKLIFFKPNLIFYVIGQGPTPAGTNNDYSYPQIITTPVGCINQDSLILIPNGIMFQSDQGIWLLERNLSVSYIGAPVERYNNLTITSAQLLPSSTQVRFTLSANTTILVYDYYVGQWSTFTGLNAVDAAVSSNTYSFLTPGGIVMTERDGVYLDDTTPISMKFQTSWLSLNQFQGFERLKQMIFASEISGATTLQFSYANDFNSTPIQVTNVPYSAVNDHEQSRIFINRQKCEAMTITLVESPSTMSAGLTQISAIGLNVAGKKGLFKLSAASTFTSNS